MSTGIEAFVRESNRIEGITRDPTSEEIEATRRFLAIRGDVTVEDLVEAVAVFQPDAVLRDRPGLNVRVGNHIPPPGGPAILTELEALLRAANARRADPYTIHCRYEMLHPFTDGNGRSGRLLWLWMRRGHAPLGFLHHFYYETLEHFR